MARVRTDRLAELVGGADLASPVPWSRVWRLADLAHHVGAIHRWAAELVATDARRYRPVRDTDDWPSKGECGRSPQLAGGRW